MRSTKWIIGFITVTILAGFIYLQNSKKNKTLLSKLNSEIKVQVKKRYDKNGNLKSDVEIVNGERHGIAHNYYNDGSIHSIIYYKNGIKEGVSTWFYENGNPYRETPFVNGQKQGIQKKYYNSGILMAEIPYNFNLLQPGTKEYTEKGVLIKNYPEFNYKVLNKKSGEGIIIDVTGKKIKKVIKYSAFYIQNNTKITITVEHNKQTIHFNVPLNKSKKGKIEVHVWLTIKTKMNNKKIIEKIVFI